MRCFFHPEAEAVAVCVHCGKGLCPECAGVSGSGRRVCSAKCAGSRAGRSYALNRYFLLCLSAVLVAAAVFYFGQELWQVSVFLLLAAFFSFRKGLQMVWKGQGLTHLYYRAGDAMEKVHAFRHGLTELLTFQGRFSAVPVTMAQLDSADGPGKARLLEQAYGEVRNRLGKELFPKEPRAQAEEHARDLEFCQALAETWFVTHANELKSLSGRGRLEREVFTKHLSLRSGIGWLATANRKLAAELGGSTKA